ncbi:MAG TPA: CsiV family protein [Steroidobacteraceae bacterium]|nr:CsiV family protein [Steroidobacteraceae bacterium]
MDRPTAPLRTLALALAAALGAALPAASQESAGPVYNVEIIVFRTATADGVPENWSEEAGARSIAGDESASGSVQVGRFAGLLPPAAGQLNELESRLRASGTYLPVAHAAWSQTASSWGTRAGFAVGRLGIDVPGLSGNVYLEHGQFLHLGLSLTWAMQNPPDGLGAASGTAFTLNETRRVRFYERNYYDHPAFGVIALVTPAQGPRAPGR